MEPIKETSASTLKKFARHLLTTTCLTAVAAGAAHGNTINESSVSGGDFGNTFATRNLLGSATTEVIGGVSGITDNDFFQIGGLLGGSAFSISGVYTNFVNYSVLNSAQGVISAGGGNPATLAGVVPGDGILVMQVLQFEGLANYDLTITAPAATTIPEPGTLAMMGLGLAGAFALRRKLAK